MGQGQELGELMGEGIVYSVLPMDYDYNEDHLRNPISTTKVNVFRQMRTKWGSFYRFLILLEDHLSGSKLLLIVFFSRPTPIGSRELHIA